MKVLLPTSGTGSRLQRATQHTNKSLVTVGDKLAICRIIELYPEDTTFIVTLGHKGELVREFLTLAYPTRNFNFVVVDKFEGPGTSLGYSILHARDFLQCPFTFHCCDTIITKPPTTAGNVMCVSTTTDTLSYASVDVEEQTVTDVYMKGANGKYSYIGVSHIEDYTAFWNALASCEPSNSLSDVHALQRMVENGIFVSYQIHDFYDTGNIGSYKKTREAFPPTHNILEKNDESLCFFPDRVIKFCANGDTNKKRVQRSVHIPGTPRILGATDHFMMMEFVNGTILSEYMKYGEVINLLTWAKNTLWVNPQVDERFRTTCMTFYKEKTFNRVRDIKTLDKLTVNGLHVGSIFSLLANVNFSELTTNTFYRFHGDFILDNIIKTSNGYTLIDWRHEFGDQLEYGDMYYDLAKLRHNIIFNHKNITNGLFEIHEGDDIIVDLKCNYMLIRQLDEFDQFVVQSGWDLKKVKLLMSIIWLNMAPLYTGRLQVFLFFFAKFNLFLQLRPYAS
jgi:CTP:phosphocholine cytidylyltransferase-like protein